MNAVRGKEPGGGQREDRSTILSGQVIGAAIRVHRALGPGLLESAYRACLAHELRLSGLVVDVERSVPVIYRECRLDCGYRIDLLVEESLIVELKAVKQLEPVHTAQVLTYMRLFGAPLGLLINFNVPTLKEGVRRIVLTAPEPLR